MDATKRLDSGWRSNLRIRQVSETYSRLHQPIRIVIRDEATFAQLPLTEIDIDFETQMILLTGRGPTTADDIGIRIDRVWREGSLIRVLERRIHPGSEHEPGIAPASPWTMVVVPKSTLNVDRYTSWVPRHALSQ